MNKKMIKFIIGILLIISISIVIVITMLNKEKEENKINIVESKDVLVENKQQRLKNENKFYTVNECIQKYLKENTDEQLIFIPIEMNILEGSSIDKYSIFGISMDEKYQNVNNLYFIVQLDSINDNYTIKKLDYNYHSLDEIIIENIDIDESLNESNFSYVTISENEKIKNYMEYYKALALGSPSILYNNFLDNEYKNNKFKTEEVFKEYIDSNKINILDSVPMEYKIEEENGIKKYTIKDNHNNNYIIKEEYIMKFNILLDNYEISNDNYKEQYNNSTDEQKIATNINKIFKMIDNKEYMTLYDNNLNYNFKNNNFKEYSEFKKYIEDNFFDYNYLGKSTLTQNDSYYVINVNYKDGISPNAEEKNLKIIMRLKEGTDFEISFEI